MKIIYCVNNDIDSQIQLSRFLKVTNHEVKVFSHGISNLFDSEINLNFLDSHKEFIDNEKTNLLTGYIKSYNPDLVIYDQSYIVPYIAYNLDIPIISYSKENLMLFSHYKSNSNLALSLKHLSNFVLAPAIADITGFSYYNSSNSTNSNVKLCRPFTFKGTKTESKQIHISCNNKKLLTPGSIYYSYNDINSVEYFNSIASSDYFIAEFLYTFVIDAIYNNKYIYAYKKLYDSNAKLFHYLEKKGLATFYNNNLNKKSIIDFDITTKQLTDYIEEI